jgi:transcriptional regulator with XRE-family HTH domain
MRSKVAKRILKNTPEDVRIFTRWYGSLIVLIQSVLQEKGYTQKKLAEQLDKRPAEINKWIKNEHNFTLRSIAKIQAELGHPLLIIPKPDHIFKTAYTRIIFIPKEVTSSYQQLMTKDKSSGKWNTITKFKENLSTKALANAG